MHTLPMAREVARGPLLLMMPGEKFGNTL